MNEPPLCPECGEWWRGHSEWCGFRHPTSKYFKVVMLRGLTKHENMNKQVLYANRVAKCAQEAMEAATWAEVFAVVSVVALEDPYEINVTPFQTIPTPEVAEAFESRWPGAQVTWFQRQPRDEAVTAEEKSLAAENQNPPL